MPIRSGIGIGEAQVFDTSGLANQYARQVASDQANLQKQALANQKRNDEFLKDLAGTVASTKTLGNGLHPEDVKQLTTYQDQIRQLYGKASQARTPQERAMIKAEVDKSFDQQLEYVNGAKYFRQAGGDLFKNMEAHPEDYEDAARTEVKDLLSNSYINAVGKGRGVINNTTYQRRPDQAPLIKAFDDLDKTVKQGAGHDVKRISTENIGGNSFRYKKSIDPLIVLNNAIVKVQSDDGLKHLLKEQYKLANPTATSIPTDEELGGQLIGIWKSKKQGQDPYSIVGEPQKIYRTALSQEEKDAKNMANYELQANKSFMSKPTYTLNEADEKVKTAEGTTAIKFEQFIPTPVSSPFDVSQIGTVFNISENKKERLPSKAGLKMTGLGYSNGVLNATIVDKEGTEYSVNPRDIPASIRNGKQYKSALSKLEQTGATQTRRTRPTVPSATPATTYTEGQIQYLMKQNPKFTRKQIIESLNTK